MNALKDDIQEIKKTNKILLAFAEWHQSMDGETACLICGDDPEKYDEYAKNVKINYEKTRQK